MDSELKPLFWAVCGFERVSVNRAASMDTPEGILYRSLCEAVQELSGALEGMKQGGLSVHPRRWLLF